MKTTSVLTTLLFLLVVGSLVMFNISLVSNIYESSGMVMSIIVAAVVIGIEAAVFIFTVMTLLLWKTFIEEKLKG